MLSLIPVGVICIFHIQFGLGSSDPCLRGNFKYLLNAGVRGGSCKNPAGQEICDYYTDSGWYKVMHSDDIEPRQMIDIAVDINFCGANYPIWLNGTHPQKGDGIVNRTACVSGKYTVCDKVYKIQIKACPTGEFVYNLQKANVCSEAYCFGKDKPCARPNPCEAGNNKILHAGNDRSTTCRNELLNFCDDHMNGYWYRVQKDKTDLKMPTVCPTQSSCGTRSPIWLDGKEPSIADKYVTRKACVNQGNSCQCAKWYNIEIRNCTTYLVYNLTSTSGCPERYCFGDNGICHEEKNNKTDVAFLKYVYIATASGVVLVVIAFTGGYIWYKKSLKFKKTRSNQNLKKSNMKEIGQKA